MQAASLINRRVLLLNQNYEPLSVCSAKRAIVLVIEGKAEMLVTADGLRLRSVRSSFALPSVVRLWTYKKVPYKRIMLTRKNVILRDDNRCQYCGTNKGPMTVDHVIPRTLGGAESWTNLVCACARCNNKKGNRTPLEAGMALRRRPFRPKFIPYISYTKFLAAAANPTWRPYLAPYADLPSLEPRAEA